MKKGPFKKSDNSIFQNFSENKNKTVLNFGAIMCFECFDQNLVFIIVLSLSYQLVLHQKLKNLNRSNSALYFLYELWDLSRSYKKIIFFLYQYYYLSGIFDGNGFVLLLHGLLHIIIMT